MYWGTKKILCGVELEKKQLHNFCGGIVFVMFIMLNKLC